MCRTRGDCSRLFPFCCLCRMSLSAATKPNFGQKAFHIYYKVTTEIKTGFPKRNPNPHGPNGENEITLQGLLSQQCGPGKLHYRRRYTFFRPSSISMNDHFLTKRACCILNCDRILRFTHFSHAHVQSCVFSLMQFRCGNCHDPI